MDEQRRGLIDQYVETQAPFGLVGCAGFITNAANPAPVSPGTKSAESQPWFKNLACANHSRLASCHRVHQIQPEFIARGTGGFSPVNFQKIKGVRRLWEESKGSKNQRKNQRNQRTEPTGTQHFVDRRWAVGRILSGDRGRGLLGEGKKGTFYFSVLGRPLGLSEDSRPSEFAVWDCQPMLPNGVPLTTLWRSELSSALVCTPFT